MDKQTSILIIEDNPEVRENLSEILELYGYDIREAPNGMEGVKAAKSFPPDIILCDVMMPELDGYGVLDILAGDPVTAGIPFVFITARTEKEDIRRGMNLGADDYITKPFYKDELLSVIKTRLKKAQLRGAPAGPKKTLLDPNGGMKRLQEVFAEEGRLQSFVQRERIVHAGELPRFLFLIEKGHVHLRRSHEYGKDYILKELGPQEFLGLPSLVEQSLYPYDALVAAKECECRVLSAERCRALIGEDPDVAAAMTRLLAGRVLEGEDHLVHQAYDSVRRRTALVLCDLQVRHEGEPIVMPREDLAQMVGTTKESVIRALSDFKREGLVGIQGSKIEVLELKALRELLV